MTFSELKPNIFQLENTFSFKLSEDITTPSSKYQPALTYEDIF